MAATFLKVLAVGRVTVDFRAGLAARCRVRCKKNTLFLLLSLWFDALNKKCCCGGRRRTGRIIKFWNNTKYVVESEVEKET